jgi:hypothetical protein
MLWGWEGSGWSRGKSRRKGRKEKGRWREGKSREGRGKRRGRAREGEDEREEAGGRMSIVRYHTNTHN